MAVLAERDRTDAIAASLTSPLPPPPFPGLMRREVLGWAAIAFAGLEVARTIAGMAAKSAGTVMPFNAIRFIAWGCVALLLWRESASQPARRGDFALLVAGLLALALPLEGAPFALVTWLVLSAIALRALIGGGWTTDERRAAMIMMALAAQTFIARWLSTIFESPILAADTAVAGWLMQLVTPGSTWEGHAIRPPGGIGVTLFMPCSSFSNLSLVWLCFVSLAAFDRVRWSWRVAAVLAGVSAVVIVMNTVRIVLMAQSLPMYEYWHYGAGGQMMALGLSASTVALCSIGSNWAGKVRRRAA